MILLDLDTLATKLRDDELTERDKYKYVVLFVVLGVLSTPNAVPASEANATFLLYFVLYHAAVLALVLIGLGGCYKINQRGDGNDFAERLCVLAGPVLLRTVIVTNVVWFFFLYVLSADAWTFSNQFIASAIIQLIAYILGIMWLRNAIEIASLRARIPAAPMF